MRSRSLRVAILVVALVFPQAWPARGADTVEVTYWLSPDQRELYVATTTPGGSRLYYFNNDTSRLCYTFTVSGRWKLDEKSRVMSSADGKGSLGQSVKSAKDLDAVGDGDLIAAAIKSYERQFAESVAALAAQGFETKDKATFTTAPFDTSTRKSVQWTASAVSQRQGRDAAIREREVLAEIDREWVLAIEASDDVAREAIESLGTARPPECYWPFIREHFPQVK
jgi:hypothetical protein